MNKIKVAYLISTLDTGGAERQLVNTVNGLDLVKYDVKVFVLKNKLTLIDQLNKLIKVEVLDVDTYANLIALNKVLKRINEFKPSILHSQMYASNLLARLYKFYDKRCKVVNHIHGLGTWIKSYHILVDKLLIKFVDKIIVVSKSSYDIRIKREKYPPKKLTIIYNSLDTKSYLEVFDSAKEPNENCILGSASRLVGLKQIDTIIDLVNILHDKGMSLQYYIAGDGPEMESLRLKVKQLGVEKYVFFLGNVADMQTFYKKIDIFIMNSQTEDMPLSILEAFASGLYVIAPDIGGIKELLKMNEGFIFKPTTDMNIISTDVFNYIQSNNIKSRSTINRNFAVKYFDIKVHQQKLDTIYNQLLLDDRS